MRLPSFKITAMLSSSFWLLSVFFIFISSNKANDILVTKIQIVFYALSFVFFYKAYSDDRGDLRGIFFIFSIALFAAFITDSINYLAFNILDHVNYFINSTGKSELTMIDSILYHADYIEMFLWHLTVFVFLLKIVNVFFPKKNKALFQFLFFSICLAGVLIVLLYFSQPGKLRNPSFYSIISFISSIIEIVTFIVAVYGLIHSKSRGVYLLLSSLVVMAITQVSALFYYNYQMVQFIKIAYITGSLWVVLVFLSGYWICVKKDYIVETWFLSPNTLEARLAFVSLVFACFSCLVFFIIAYSFEPINEYRTLSLFLFLMSYSLIAVLVSKRVACFFSQPFQKLQANVSEFIANQSNINKPDSFEIAEFDYLQNVIYERFHEHEYQREEINKMANKAIQVAHDIRSPASAIMMLVKDNDFLPEEQRVSLRNAATRVQDIATNLLSDYKQNVSIDDRVVLMLIPAIMSVLAEKRAQYNEHFLKFNIALESSTFFVHAKLHPVEFKCMLSNLINNAIESIPEGRAGEITLAVKILDKNVVISITDNGCGIKRAILRSINRGEKVNSSKKFGFGFGLQQAAKFMHDESGRIIVSSEVGRGTCIELVFSLAPMPCWLADSISFHSGMRVIVLDDDTAIHGAWNQRFSQWVVGDASVSLIHFCFANECIDYIDSLSKDEKNNILLLTDYELLNQTLSGLDVIEKVNLKQAILVTSYYDDIELIKRSILLGVKILPKMIAADVELLLADNKKGADNFGDGILLDDQAELSEIIQYLAKRKKFNLDYYKSPYDLWVNIENYSLAVPIYIDYDLGLPISGVEVAEVLYSRGYKNLYLATGYQINQNNVPSYLKVFSNKMSLLNFENQDAL